MKRRAVRGLASLSEKALRRAAWSLWWAQGLAMALCLSVSLATEVSPGTWGSGGRVTEIVVNLLVLVFPLTGLVILNRLPRNRIGWVLQGVGLAWLLPGLLSAWAEYGLVVRPGSLPGADVAAALNEGIWAPFIGMLGIFLVLLFPDGRLPAPGWRYVGWAAAAAMVLLPVVLALEPGPLEGGPIPSMENPIGIEAAAGTLTVMEGALLPLLSLGILASATALVVRLRRSTGIQRKQLTWLAAAGSIVAVVYVLMVLATLVGSFADEVPGWVTAMQNLTFLSFLLLPVAIGIAVLRYRLFDIDVVINRALVYGSLTATLLVTYMGSVLLLRGVLPPVASDSDLAVAVSTLAVAALFRPVRRRIQVFVDRRFYRRRYDAARTLEAFGGKLREELDVSVLADDLGVVVRETMQPAHMSVWLRSTP